MTQKRKDKGKKSKGKKAPAAATAQPETHPGLTQPPKVGTAKV